MTDHITADLEAELANLKKQLEETDIFKDIQALERIIRRRNAAELARQPAPMRDSFAPQERQESVFTGRQEAATSIAMKDAAEKYLADQSRPAQTKDIFDAITREGVRVPGESPQNNLSAHLSRDERFLSLGRNGWVLSSTVASEFEAMAEVAREYVEGLSNDELNTLKRNLSNFEGLPADVDGHLLFRSKGLLGRNLKSDERRALRNAVRNLALQNQQ